MCDRRSSFGAVTAGKRQCFVRLASVITPSKFWAAEIPPPGEIDPLSPLGSVLNLESELTKLHGEQRRLGGFLQTSAIAPGMLVAARPVEDARRWYRAKVVSVDYQPRETRVGVFLVDYGDFFADLPLSTAVRRLPKTMEAHPEHLTFQVVLAGLRPLSWQLDVELRVKRSDPTSAASWNRSTVDIVLGLWKASPEKLASLLFWKNDAIGRRHGVVELLGFDREIVLNSLLVKSGHAKFFTQALEWDMNDQLGTSSGPMFLSICGNRSFDGHSSLYNDDGFYNVHLHHSLSSQSSEPGSGIVPLEYLDPETGTRPNNYHKLPKATAKRMAGLSMDETDQGDAEALDGSYLIGGGHAGAAEKKPTGCRELWKRLAASRAGGGSTDQASIKEDEESDEGEAPRKGYADASIMKLPAGIDTGRFIQAQLQRIPGQPRGGGPKKIADILN